MTKVVVNGCYGGFNLSHEAILKLIEYGMPVYDDWEPYKSEKKRPEVHIVRNPTWNGKHSIYERQYYISHIDHKMTLRTHPLVVKTVEELGEKANGFCAELEIKDVPREPDEITIEEYDGIEWVAEKHETW